ncbi:MAG: 50S ribosomal protein L25 [Desulfobacterales bacterium]|nr:50S ribosomal protein L25 [Desulfobacterales bacterium]
MEQSALAVRVRESKGKGAARKLRRNKQVPAIFYGPKTESIMIAVDYSELRRVVTKSDAENIILDLQVQSDQGTETRKAMLKELVADPIEDTYIHADFYEISMDKEITVDIPIHLINTPEGVVNGGILQHVRRTLTVSCLPDKLISFFELDVAALDIGDSLHVRDIEVSEGINLLDEEHLTVAVVAAPTVVEEVAEEEEEIEGEEGAEGVEEGAEGVEEGAEAEPKEGKEK